MLIEDFRKLSKEDLSLNLKANEDSLQKLYQTRHSSKVEPEAIKSVKKRIAAIKKVQKENKLKELVIQFTGKKHIPKELRPKLNKALRMKLSNRQYNLKSKSQRNLSLKYPKKIFSFNPLQ